VLRMELAWNAVRVAAVVLALAVGSLAQDGSEMAKAGPHPASEKAKAEGVASGPDVKTSSKPAPGALTSDDPQVYRIGVEDELGITVWHEPDMSATVVVRPDGMISLPLLNDLKVTGMTTRQLQDVLTEKLKDFLKEPQVSVMVRQIRSRKVYLLGAVNHPGTYQLNNRKTVLQLLAEAGGPGPYAKLKSIYVIRHKEGAEVRLPFHYKKVVSGNKSAHDIVLQPGDMVVVP
jgi:polysaccharide export outer membrane protein